MSQPSLPKPRCDGEFIVRVHRTELKTKFVSTREPATRTVKHRMKMLTAPLNDMNVQAKVQLVLNCFYQWPALGRRLTSELHKEYKAKQLKKDNLRKRLWKQKKRADHQAAKTVVKKEKP